MKLQPFMQGIVTWNATLVATETRDSAIMTGHNTDLTAEEVDLLWWLSKEDFSQYGECHGRALRGLVKKGFVQVHEGREYQDRAGFIAKGDDPMYRAVSLTEAGVATIKAFAAIWKATS